MPSARPPKLPTIEYYWSLLPGTSTRSPSFVVNVRIKAANGLIVGQITQGSKDKRDARRCVNALASALGCDTEAYSGEWVETCVKQKGLREAGPGPKPNVEAKVGAE